MKKLTTVTNEVLTIIPQEAIKKALRIFCDSLSYDKEWAVYDNFEIEKSPVINGKFMMWGWGCQNGHNPQDYSWIIYDITQEDKFQVSWKKGNYTSVRDVDMEGKSINYPLGDDDDYIETTIDFPSWPEEGRSDFELTSNDSLYLIESVEELRELGGEQEFFMSDCTDVTITFFAPHLNNNVVSHDYYIYYSDKQNEISKIMENCMVLDF